MPDDAFIEFLCEAQHNAYENAAAAAGWSTQIASRVPWPEVPEENKVAMRKSLREVLQLLDNRGYLKPPDGT